MKSRLLDSLHSIWGSVAFRLTLNYSVFALSTSLILLAFFYYQTVGILDSQFSRQVSTTAQRMSAHFDQRGLPGLINEINLELADHVNSDTEMFLLIDTQGKPLAGNIEPDPFLLALEQTGANHEVILRGHAAHGYLVARRLPDGSKLIVGHDLRDLLEITQIIKRVSLAAISVTALLVLLGAYLFRRTLQRRVEVIRRTAWQIGAGELTQRIPIARRQDEFALLTHDINNMLDRIELLMHGVRNVSDSVAHHLRTPLTRILARLRTALRPDSSYDELRNSIVFLADEIEDLAKVSEKLLQIAELESGTRRKKFELARLDVIASDVVDLYEAVAEENHATLRLMAHGPVSVYGDRDLLAGAIACLVDNALKYAGDSACIRVQVATADRSGEARIIVADNGPGILPDKHQRVGERFYRLNSDVPGYGLGLATVIAVARLHGASFDLHNTNPGLHVSLTFPVQITPDEIAGGA
ncbi:HAMP domain-containing protein [Alcaligenaceae bacterium]|nr:HAMP domain-containing protein [Alcaligenaceae bacterium]